MADSCKAAGSCKCSCKPNRVVLKAPPGLRNARLGLGRALRRDPHEAGVAGAGGEQDGRVGRRLVRADLRPHPVLGPRAPIRG